MSPASRGFRHLHRATDEDAGRVPPGQYVTESFPVLSAGPTPRTPLKKWTFSITQGGRKGSACHTNSPCRCLMSRRKNPCRWASRTKNPCR